MKPTKILLAVSLLFSLVACSNQSRTAAEMATQEDLFGQNGVFFEIQANSGNGLLQSLSVNSFVNEKSSYLYHARETAGRPASSILSVGDMSALDRRYPVDAPSSQIGLSAVDVIFVDNVSQNGQRSFALAFRVEDAYTQAVNYFSGSSQLDDYTFNSDRFETAIQMQNGSVIVVQSTDLSADYNNELSDAIKLNLYELGQNNSLRYIGQISTMMGYGYK